MSARYRILLVEGDPGYRLALSAAFSREQDCEIIGRASTLDAALLQVANKAPNVLLLDAPTSGAEPSEGLLSLLSGDEIRVIADTPEGAAAPLRALLGGAWVTCRRYSGDRSGVSDWLRAELLPLLRKPSSRAAAPPERLERLEVPERPARPASPARPVFLTKRPRPLEVLALAASTGGPDALTVLLGTLPEHFPLPVVVVQHMPASFSSRFAEQLARCCRLPVRLAEDKHPLTPGVVWLAPGDQHMQVRRVDGALVLATNREPPEHGCRPAADPLFRSLAVSAPNTTLAAVLTGMGYDGGPGSRVLTDAGGVVYAQDEATSVVWGMPAAVVQAGAAAKVLPLEELGPALCEQVKSRQRAA